MYIVFVLLCQQNTCFSWLSASVFVCNDEIIRRYFVVFLCFLCFGNCQRISEKNRRKHFLKYNNQSAWIQIDSLEGFFG